MNTLIIYESFHHGNTRKVAQAINEILQGKIIPVTESQSYDLNQFDLIGLGSGVYHDDLHNTILALGERESLQEKSIFLFSTSKNGDLGAHDNFKKILKRRGARVSGEFACRGYDTSGLWKWLGGRGKDHPDPVDLDLARKFAQKLLQELHAGVGI